jgi:hypothetical protein
MKQSTLNKAIALQAQIDRLQSNRNALESWLEKWKDETRIPEHPAASSTLNTFDMDFVPRTKEGFKILRQLVPELLADNIADMEYHQNLFEEL